MHGEGDVMISNDSDFTVLRLYWTLDVIFVKSIIHQWNRNGIVVGQLSCRKVHGLYRAGQCEMQMCLRRRG